MCVHKTAMGVVKGLFFYPPKTNYAVRRNEI